MSKIFSFHLIQSPQPYLPPHKRVLKLIDLISQRAAKISFLPPRLLLTKNRKDIEYRVEFLRDVIDNGIAPQRTLYYQFISDDDKGVILNVDIVAKNFLSLYHDIKANNITNPIAIGQYSGKTINTRHIVRGKKTWKRYPNENGYQVINGAHRLAVALFLNLENVPVRIYRSASFEIPNYTDYLQIKELEYKRNIENQN